MGGLLGRGLAIVNKGSDMRISRREAGQRLI